MRALGPRYGEAGSTLDRSNVLDEVLQNGKVYSLHGPPALPSSAGAGAGGGGRAGAGGGAAAADLHTPLQRSASYSQLQSPGSGMGSRAIGSRGLTPHSPASRSNLMTPASASSLSGSRGVTPASRQTPRRMGGEVRWSRSGHGQRDGEGGMASGSGLGSPNRIGTGGMDFGDGG